MTGVRVVAAPPPALTLFVAVLAMSWAGPLVRFTGAPALAVSAWRLAFSVGIIAVVLAVRGGASWRLGRRDRLLAVLAGVLLAAHFWSWIASIDMTTVASSVVLVSTQPVFVAIFSTVFLAERPTRTQVAGILVAVLGAAVIGWGDFGSGRRALLGDALAVAGAVFASGYYVIGRRLRQSLDLWSYIAVVYGIAAALLMLALLGHPAAAVFGYGRGDWLVFVLLAIGPMMLGHTGVNYALRYIPAYIANLVLLGEPLGAALIAYAVPAIGEVPSGQTIVGGCMILVGIGAGILSRRPPVRGDPTSHGSDLSAGA